MYPTTVDPPSATTPKRCYVDAIDLSFPYIQQYTSTNSAILKMTPTEVTGHCFVLATVCRAWVDFLAELGDFRCPSRPPPSRNCVQHWPPRLTNKYCTWSRRAIPRLRGLQQVPTLFTYTKRMSSAASSRGRTYLFLSFLSLPLRPRAGPLPTRLRDPSSPELIDTLIHYDPYLPPPFTIRLYARVYVLPSRKRDKSPVES